jgi:competence protein ComEA
MNFTRSLTATLLGITLLGTALAAAQEPSPKVDLNRASVEQLETLPQVGPVLAQRIVEFRSKQGPFRTVDDLLKVQGVGEKLLTKLRDRITVTGQKQ